ncbi:hypothetical protein ACWEU6_37085 [Streptosporangium sandarakinum]|uniref:Sulfotransferase family protein n=1 Tax=Streptosporangium pseudovulgare TaxID=35765 RepID=A0ABQ2RD88_9ACTN|nr:hypothetical protein [Streptosporangium pseudovulgare]GGQ20799.1 hypothetical protein GCM10010140_58830 [Streptosporangium pseudovulgare]
MTPEEVEKMHAKARRKSRDPERLDQLRDKAMKEAGGGTPEGLAHAITIYDAWAEFRAAIRPDPRTMIHLYRDPM